MKQLVYKDAGKNLGLNNRSVVNIDLRYFLKHALIGLIITSAILGRVVQSAEPAEQDVQIFFDGMDNDQHPKLLSRYLAYPKLLQKFYQQRAYTVAWYPPLRQDKAHQALLDFIAEIEKDGLFAEDYHYSTLLEHCQQPVKAENLLACDILSTDSALLLQQHILAGKVDPNRFKNSEVAKQPLDLVDLLEQALAAPDLAAYIEQHKPSHIYYQLLKEQLARLRSLPDPNWQPFDVSGSSIKPGATDARVSQLVERLIYWGDLASDFSFDSTNPLYSPEVEVAVKRYQKRHGLEVDGVVGKASFDALNVSKAERIEQMLINMERWRWLAEKLGERFVLVNIAGFEVYGVENDQVTFQKPIITGKNHHQTPVFSDEIEYVVINPTWTVPYSIAVNETLPRLKKDPSYLQQKNFGVYRNYSERVNTSNIDWSQYSRGNFPFQFVQAPGKNNALGQVKFIFPNSHSIYLHDTPSKQLFSRTSRAFSHGCIRVFEPFDLAEWLLAPQGVTRQEIENKLNQKTTKTVYLKQKLPVHLTYWTAFIDEERQLNFRPDIYKRDPQVSKALHTSVQQTLAR
ncbi:murein L,D-transpeptidase [Kangiella sp. TOML190]|uniref:L,D-transpeptidase family protein n=1 Tax=Kangiella sp. TOML190 TaxID=2931351 RepID=UPI00203FA488|nr:L,D-transpeptidase family protein [Kangiella sp. TOML190]